MKIERQSPAKGLFKFEPRDLWVGVFWDLIDTQTQMFPEHYRYRWRLLVFICPLPCCLIRFAVEFGAVTPEPAKAVGQ